MRILQLTMKGYRQFHPETKLVFPKKFSVIAGVNGRGKTAILDAIVILLSRLLPQISPARSGSKKLTPLDINRGTKKFELMAKFNCAGIPLDFGLTYTRAIGDIKQTKLFPATRQEIKFAYGDPAIAGDQAPLVVYYTTDRAGYRFPKALPKTVPPGQAMAYNGALVNRTVDYKDLMARFRVALSLRSQKSRNDKLSYPGGNVVNAINKAISIFLDGFTDLHILDNPPRLLIRKHGEVRDIRQLSDGERSFIALVSDLGRRLALANPDLADPLQGAGVVLIDELELHLHPKWQLEVTEKLRATFPNIQFIVTTHSPFIIQTARQGEVISLDGELEIDPYGKSLEEVARYVMDVENTEYSPRIKRMRDTARQYPALAEEAKQATPERKIAIHREIIQLLEPFSDNPAYTALLERKGMLDPQ